METLSDVWGDFGVRVRRYVGSRVNDPHAADDITQDVLLKMRTKMDSLLPEEKLPAWVFAMARNTIIDYYRGRTVRDHAQLDDADLVADARGDKRRVMDELTPCLTRMIEHLPEPYREAMKLADIEGLNQQEVADRTGISLSGAKSRVQRARQHLREMVLDCCKVERDGRGNVMNFETTARSSRYCGDEDGNPQCGR